MKFLGVACCAFGVFPVIRINSIGFKLRINGGDY